MLEFDIDPGINLLPNLGVTIQDVPAFVFAQLKKDCLEGIKNIDENIENTTGDILQMFHQDVPKDFFFQQPTNSKEGLEREIIKICKDMIQVYPEYMDKLNHYSEESDNWELCVERFWINYQRPGEFIPLHRHSGIFSFTIWVNLPEQIDENIDVEKWNLGKGYQGQFEFAYSDMLGQIKTLRLASNKSFEGKVCVFPSELQHQVYPHYQDEYRITVSGNIRVKK